jgi:hypothetical protein
MEIVCEYKACGVYSQHAMIFQHLRQYGIYSNDPM